MAIFNFQILLYSLSMFCFLFPKTNSLTFNLSTIGPQHEKVNITIFGDAAISPSGLQVTQDERITPEVNISDLKFLGGKATYVDKLHLWDKSSGFLADFYTHFVFVIDSDGNHTFADGITFFLAPEGSDLTIGGALGLPITKNATSLLLHKWDPDSYTSPFVAVEFDTYKNPWDLANISTHVGIDVNSLKSNVTTHWHCDVPQGIQNEAWIRYDSSSYNLSVVFTGSTNSTNAIHLIIDLRDYLPEFVTFGFTAGTGSYVEKHTVKSWQFNSSEDPEKPGKDKISPRARVGLVVGLGVFVGGIVWFGFALWRRSRAQEKDEFEVEMSMENEFESGSGPKKFSNGQLSRATKNFAEEQKLGEGGFGGVYRGFLRELNSNIAVKRISKGSKQGIREYATEVKIISRLRHRNLVQLLGWCHEKKQLLLVYEFMENGSLDSHLFKGKSLLAWATRSKIVQGLAMALLYLHEEWEQCVVHRDIKSSNVMLDSNFNAKLGDFGLARFVDHEKGPHTTIVAGTLGYLAPECVVTCKATKESDVYSFGVVALEIACGRKTYDLKVPESQMIMVEWVWGLYGMGRLLEAVDTKLGIDFDELEMERVMIVGLWCAHPDHNFRPNIRQAIHVLNFEAPLPILPQKKPLLSYFSPSLKIDSSKFTSSSTA